MSEKKCFKCGAMKPLTDFYKHKRMADGRVNKCKSCNKIDVRENRLLKVKYYRDYDASRYQSDPSVRLRISTISKKWRDENPDGYKAHTAVGNAIRSGKLIKEPCEVCGLVKVHAHHDDYKKPLTVRWLCPAHHKEHHDTHTKGEPKNDLAQPHRTTAQISVCKYGNR